MEAFLTHGLWHKKQLCEKYINIDNTVELSVQKLLQPCRQENDDFLNKNNGSEKKKELVWSIYLIFKFPIMQNVKHI